jgi:hypothetical protein
LPPVDAQTLTTSLPPVDAQTLTTSLPPAAPVSTVRAIAPLAFDSLGMVDVKLGLLFGRRFLQFTLFKSTLHLHF